MNCVKRCINTLVSHSFKNVNPVRWYSSATKDVKRFYKEVTLAKANGAFEINLDRLKLRTPLGKIVQIPSEPIALAVAEEWRTQDKVINRFNMHLTSLTNMCIDRKDLKDHETTFDKMLEFLNTDTVCFRSGDPPELMQLQKEKWDPIVGWAEERFNVKIPVTFGLSLPNIPSETREEFVTYLRSFNDWALTGYEQAVECLKSFVIATAVVNRKVSVEEAVQLSSLELDFQTSAWGTVEWKHTIDEADMKARLAAAMLLYTSTQLIIILPTREMSNYTNSQRIFMNI